MDIINGKELRPEYIECICGSPDHILRITDWGNGEMLFEIYLNLSWRFFKRLWLAIKYVFKYKTEEQYWQDIFLEKESVLKLRDLCDKCLENKNET